MIHVCPGLTLSVNLLNYLHDFLHSIDMPLGRLLDVMLECSAQHYTVPLLCKLWEA